MQFVGSLIYIVLFGVALLPPLLGRKPFTYYVSRSRYPEAIVKSALFLRINRRLSFVWAAIFALAFVLANLPYSDTPATTIALSILIPFLPQILLGIPLSILLPKYLMQKPTVKMHFLSNREAFEAMPFGLNVAMAQGVDAVIGFDLSGEEAGEHTLTIRDNQCHYHVGLEANMTLLIEADSALWLAIVNGDIDGTQAYLAGEYKASGDLELLARFESFFDAHATPQIIPDRVPDYTYAKLQKPIRTIAIFDGGVRKKAYSKTTLMVDKFIEGARSAGATVELFRLDEMQLKQCVGCYTCWTATPGTCIHKDDMPMLLEKHKAADLIVYASPLYIFSVTGVMKTFLDRLLPLLEPYMQQNASGHIIHPSRYAHLGEQGFVVFSAGGFPDVEGNFDGLSAIFRAWDKHNALMQMMGEFYMPASEIIAQPFYRTRRERVEQACFAAGVQAVREGRIDYAHMAKVSNPGTTHETFKKQADNFWATLDGQKAYLRAVPKL